MYRFYRLDKDEQDKDFLTVVDTCAIQGDRIPSVPEKYHNLLFHLGLDAAAGIVVRSEYCAGVPETVIRDVEKWVNDADDKKALPTYFHTTILFNGVETLPHLHLVYIAENEEEVWNFIKG